MNKILLTGEKGKYSVAKKSENELNLEPTEREINARKLTHYGFEFTFGSLSDYQFNICGYTHETYRELNKKFGTIAPREEIGKENLNRTINGLEKLMKEKGADYVLLDKDKFVSADNGTYWEISGRGQLLLEIDFPTKKKFRIGAP